MSKLTLYELSNEFKKLLDNLEDHDDTDLIEYIEEIEASFNQKSLNVGKMINEIEDLCERIREKEKTNASRRQSLKNKALSLRNYLRENFEKTGTSKVQDEDISISIQNNPAKVNIIDESLIPQKFISTKTVESTDKKAIKESLQNNEEVPGCELVQEKRINIK